MFLVPWSLQLPASLIPTFSRVCSFLYEYPEERTYKVEATLTLSSGETFIVSSVVSVQQPIGDLALSGPEAVPIHE